MTESKLPAAGSTGTAASGRPVPTQAPTEAVGVPDVVRPTVPEQAVAPAEETLPPVQEAIPTRPRRHLLHRRKPRRQTAFRRWRKTRPFWGGLLTMLAGAEIAAVTGASYKLLFVSKSVGFAIAVGAVIAVFGLTMWLSPVLSKLLGLLTLVAALLSFVTSNLGGFLLGMLLAILGGGLSFAWEPGRELAESSAAGPTTAENQAAGAADDREFEPLDRFFEG